jgi:predicted histidine transporter YuiF (NhaC family)
MNICQSKIALSSIGGILDYLSCLLVQSVVPLLFALAVVGFIWGVIQTTMNPEDAEKRKQGKMYMMWGIIGLFVMLSIWGLVEIITNTFGIQVLIPQLSQ